MDSEDECVELKDDSSFEIISSSEDEECFISTSLWSSPLQASLHFSSLGDSFSSEKVIKKDNVRIVATNYYNGTHQLQTESSENSDFHNRYLQDTKNASIQSTTDAISSDTQYEIQYYNTNNILMVKGIESYSSPTLGNIEDTASQYQPILKADNDLKEKYILNRQLAIDIKNASIQLTGDTISFDTKFDNQSYNTKNIFVVEDKEICSSPIFQIIEKTEYQYQPIEKVENYLNGETFYDRQLSTDIRNALMQPAEDAISLDAKCENQSYNTSNNLVADGNEKYFLPSSEIIGKLKCSYQSIEKVENYLKGKNSYDSQLDTDFKNASMQLAGDVTSFNTGIEKQFYRTNNDCVVEGIDSYSFPTYEITENTACEYQPIEKVENSSWKSVYDSQLDIDGGILVADLFKDAESPTDFLSSPYEIESNVNRRLTRRTVTASTASHMHPERKNSYESACSSVMKRGLNIRKWLTSYSWCLQNFVAGAKSSFYNLLNKIEVEINSLLGMDDPVRIIIIADEEDCNTIETAFCQTLRGQVAISACQIDEDRATIPVLPIGYDYALLAAQSKINNARQLLIDSEKVVMITTTNFIAEVIPQRWQTSTVLWLDDPNLHLNLHNFTSTIPVPNEYIYTAQIFTPENYHLKERGLAVTLEEVIGHDFENQQKDTQEFLCGVNRFVRMKSAADILAGMYKQYSKRFD